MNILSTKHDDLGAILKAATVVLKAGGLVIFPTETTYGAGVDATNPKAVEKLLAYKSRREGKPLSIAVTDIEMAEKYVELNEQARALYAQFLPGPVTVVSSGKGVVSPGVESEFGTLGVRIPDYQLVLDMVSALGAPITATSANGSGEKRPYTIEDILGGLSEKQKSLIDLIIDAGQLPKNPPSTVIDTTLTTPVTLRRGDVEWQEATKLVSRSEEETKAIAGRLMLKHWDDVGTHGLVIALDGSLGMGKTIFTKGVAEFLQIHETISSPTYTYIQEYDFVRHQTTGQLFHLDVWKVDSKELFEKLEIEKIIGPNNVVVIEWFSQVAEYYNDLILSKFDDSTTRPTFLSVRFDQEGEERMLHISDAIKTTEKK